MLVPVLILNLNHIDIVTFKCFGPNLCICHHPSRFWIVNRNEVTVAVTMKVNPILIVLADLVHVLDNHLLTVDHRVLYRLVLHLSHL